MDTPALLEAMGFDGPELMVKTDKATSNNRVEKLIDPPSAAVVKLAFQKFRKKKKDTPLIKQLGISAGQFSVFKNHGDESATPSFAAFCEAIGIDVDAAIVGKFVPLAEDQDALELIQTAKRLAATGKAKRALKHLKVVEEED